MLDIDHFKAINDTYGHPAGDAVLVEVAQRLCETVRGTDLVARYGGEEFAVLSVGEGAAITAERLRSVVAAAPVHYAGTPIRVSLSAGVSNWNSTIGENAGALINAADQALYRAKESGRNRVCVAD